MRFFEDFEYVTFFITLIIGTMFSGLILLFLGPLIVQFTDYIDIGITPGGLSMALGYSLVAAWHVSINIDQVPKKKDEDEDED